MPPGQENKKAANIRFSKQVLLEDGKAFLEQSGLLGRHVPFQLQIQIGGVSGFVQGIHLLKLIVQTIFDFQVLSPNTSAGHVKKSLILVRDLQRVSASLEQHLKAVLVTFESSNLGRNNPKIKQRNQKTIRKANKN